MADAQLTTPVYNDNQACVQWSHSLTKKGVKHINLKENMVREAHQAKHVDVAHIPGVINSSDIFTKEIKDAAHFRRLRDSMMVSLANFQKHGHNVPEHWSDKTNLPYYSIRSPGGPSSQVTKNVRFAPGT